MTTAAKSRITRNDLEAGFRSLEEDVSDKTETAKSYALAVGAAVVVVVVAVAFLAGRRRGRKRSTVVEIRRI